MAKPRIKRAPMAEINLVPYIDLMLVLLVIFMITAPLLSQGVDVELPQAVAESLDQQSKEPVVVTVDLKGDFYINIGDGQDKPISADLLVQRTAAILRHQPGTPVMVRGDAEVGYGKVVYVMTLLQQAGAPSVGLVTEMPES